jgi:hypothetical protein
MGNYKEESVMDEHILLDLVANSQMVLKGIQYGVFVQDIDVLTKAVIDLKEVANVMQEVIDNDFGE